MLELNILIDDLLVGVVVVVVAAAVDIIHTVIEFTNYMQLT